MSRVLVVTETSRSHGEFRRRWVRALYAAHVRRYRRAVAAALSRLGSGRRHAPGGPRARGSRGPAGRRALAPLRRGVVQGRGRSAGRPRLAARRRVVAGPREPATTRRAEGHTSEL